MDSLTQLKKVREDAIARLRACDDYKLIGKLGDLITELGGSLSPLSIDAAIGQRSTDHTSHSHVAAKASSTTTVPISSFQTKISSADSVDHGSGSSEEPSNEDNVEAAENLVDELVAELESEDLSLDEQEEASDDNKKQEIPAVSIFQSVSNRAANGAVKSV